MSRWCFGIPSSRLEVNNPRPHRHVRRDRHASERLDAHAPSEGADGRYILGDLQAVITPALFGLPVVPTQAMAVDKFLVGSYQQAGTLYDRWAARVEVSTEHADFFVRNLVAILAEERIGLAVKQPLALTYGDFGNVA